MRMDTLYCFGSTYIIGLSTFDKLIDRQIARFDRFHFLPQFYEEAFSIYAAYSTAFNRFNTYFHPDGRAIPVDH